METLWQDAKYGARMLLKSRSVTLIVVLMLALGIGANTAIFSVVYGVLLRPLPYPEPERIVQVAWKYGDFFGDFNDQQYRFTAEHARSFQHIAATTGASFTLLGGEEPQRVQGLHVTPDYFSVLGVPPALGRGIAAEEDVPGAARVAVLSDAVWKTQFAARTDVVGRTIHLNGEPYTVVGVMPAAFSAPSANISVWLPLAPVARTIGSGSNYTVLARLKPGVAREQAQAEASLLAAGLRREFPKTAPRDSMLTVDPYKHALGADLREPLLVILAAVGFVLLIACMNVANLLLARTTARSREIAVRLAMGASRLRLIRQLLTECLLLSACGGILGIVVAQWSVSALLALAPRGMVAAGDVQLDLPVLVFALALAGITGLFFGVAPALSATRTDPQAALKEGSTRATSGIVRGRLRGVLVTGEVALSLVLLVGSALLIRTMVNLLRSDPGFDPSRVLSLQVWATGGESNTSGALAGQYERILERLKALPGVESATVVGAGLPLQRGGNVAMKLDGASDDDLFSADFRAVTPEYFQTLGVPLRSGRLLAASDSEGAPAVAVINEAFARRRFRDKNPIGQRIWMERTAREVVGVVGNVRSYLNQPAPPTAFLPVAQTSYAVSRIFEGWYPTSILVRTAGEPLLLSHAVERAVRETAPQIPMSQPRSLGQVFHVSVATQHFQMWLMTAFAALAALLAAIGLYGVISQLVAERTHEIGVRVALGAQRGDILRMVMGQGMRLAVAGLAVGIGAAYFLGRFLQSLLYQVEPRDVVSFAAVTLLLGFVALLACLLPARRATRVDPIVALRYE